VPQLADAQQWKADRGLLRSEHVQLASAVRALDPQRLDDAAPGSGNFRLVDLLFGIVSHDLYHVGQIQVLKRMYETRAGRSERRR
jgi:uncharacterized damage-inducible protein DinB